MMGAAFIGLGRLASAESALRSAIADLRRTSGTAHLALIYVAALLAEQGRAADAALTIGFVDGSLDTGAMPLSPGQRRYYDRALAILTVALSIEELDQFRTEGRRKTEAEVLALALPPKS